MLRHYNEDVNKSKNLPQVMSRILLLLRPNAGSAKKQSKQRSDMKFILMMHVPKGGAYQSDSWPKKDYEAHIAYWNSLNKELSRAGELVVVEGLARPGEAKVVRASQNGAPITDGVFPESKEFLAGYWIVDVASPQRAYEIAARASAAPGAGGVPLNMQIEVRQVMMSKRPHELL
jgi:hypothetical protein